MRIEIFANGTGSVSQLQSGLSDLHSSISATIEDLRAVNRRMANLSGGLGNLSGAYQSVNSRIAKEERRLTAVERVSRASSTFLSNTVCTDSRVARLVNQSQERFFDTHPWLRPVVTEEKSWWEQRVEDWNNFWNSAGEFWKSVCDGVVDWVKKHAVEIIIGAVAIVVGAAIVALTGGAAAAFIPALLAGLKAAAISAVISGAISATIAALTGGDVLTAFGDGLASGFMWGGILFAISSTISAIRSAISAGKTAASSSTVVDTTIKQSSHSVSTAQYGDQLGKMGTYVENPGVSIDWTKPAVHGSERMLERGISQELADEIVKNGKVLSQAGGNKFVYITKKGVVVLSKEGKLITCWGAKDFTSEMIEIVKKLFG